MFASSATSRSATTFLLKSALCPRRCVHATSTRWAITNMEMPAMSPTMTEGGIASWKKTEGESFTAGEVLLEIETDKATIDVEAQEDGVMGKILLHAGSKNVPVGKVIALLAEEGDDISNLEAPKEETTPKQPEQSSSHSTSAPSHDSPPAAAPQAVAALSHHPTHSRPLFPSVLRLLVENGISDPTKITGTGVRGMLTKGDVLAFLGKASGPMGTFKEPQTQPSPAPAPKQEKKEEEVKPLDGPALRRLIVGNMLRDSVQARAKASSSTTPATFDTLVDDYLNVASPGTSTTSSKPKKAVLMGKKSTEEYFNGLI